MDTIGIVRSARSNINSHACIHIRLYISCHMPTVQRMCMYNMCIIIIYNHSNIICIYYIYTIIVI